jgi:hypothetical protein
MPLVAIGQQLCPKRRGALGDQARDVDGRLYVAERIMRVVTGEAIHGRDTIKLEAHAPGFIDGPVEQIGLTVPDSIERRQHVETRVAVELGGEDVGLQVLVEGLAQHLLVKADAVEPGPDGRRPTINQPADLLRELEECWQGPVQQLRWAHASYRQSPGRWD